MRAVLAALFICLLACQAQSREIGSQWDVIGPQVVVRHVVKHERGVRKFAQAKREKASHDGAARAAAPDSVTVPSVAVAIVHSGVVTVQTAAGIPITVAAHLAAKFQSLVADFVAAGYHPHRIGCFAHGGHVRNSRHYAGAACDFDQRGWGKTVAFMYTARAHAIIVANGFRDGREFRDQGHVDDGLVRYVGAHHRNRHYGG